MPDEVQPQSAIATAQEAATFKWDSDKLEPGIGIALSGGGFRAMLFPAVALARMNEGITGSSRVVARALVLKEPPSLDAGEITDKGSLNSRGICERRQAEGARL